MKYFISIVIAVVVLSVGISLFVVGSPQRARMRRFDEIRVQNLQFIQDQIFSYWMDKRMVPAKLTDLNDDIRQVRMPMDPMTGESYTYEKKGSDHFVLCAAFTLSNEPADAASGLKEPYPSYAYGPFIGEQTWEHKTGKTCFDRTIDKERYPQQKAQ